MCNPIFSYQYLKCCLHKASVTFKATGLKTLTIIIKLLDCLHCNSINYTDPEEQRATHIGRKKQIPQLKYSQISFLKIFLVTFDFH